MKKKIFLFILLLVLLPIVAFAYDCKINGIYYNLNDNTNEATVTYYKYGRDNAYAYTRNVVIPQNITYDGIKYDVTSIGPSAFYQCDGLKSVEIPNSVTSIGSSAFYNCAGLTSVTIPNSVTSIGYKAFYYLFIEKLYIDCAYVPVFNNNPFLKEIVLGDNVTSIGGGAFSGCSGLTSVTIPNSVTSIGDYAFEGCSGLTSIEIPNSVTSIGDQAFSGCSGLTSVEIPNSITSIGDQAFGSCSGLTSVEIPNSVTSIGRFAFSGCSGLTSLKIEDGENDLIFSISSYSDPSPFNACPVEKLYLGRNVSVSYYKDYYEDLSLFKNNIKLKTLTIGNSVTSIGGYAFSGCSSLTSITIPNSVTSIGRGAFSGCSSSIIFPNDVKSMEIANDAFKSDDVYVEANTCGLLTLWKNGYTPYKLDTDEKLLPPTIEYSMTASSISATGSYVEGTVNVVNQSIQMADNELIDGNEVFVSGLNPGQSYIVKYNIEVDYGGEETATYTKTGYIYTKGFQAKMAQPKVVSEGNVIVSATTNLDEEETNVGFEWRCTDWTNEFPSNTGTAYLYDGVIEGYIKNLNTSKLWKCRPYYLSNSGVYHYGNWMGIDPTNTSYFEPTVHTYSKVTIKGNTALVRGYALSGTDEVKVQGFKYWKTRGGSGHQHKVVAVPSNALTVELSNKQQTLTTTLSNLEYDSEYCCIAFVTTTDGNTFYGEEQKFITGESPSEIECVETESDTDESLIEVARYNVNGQKIDAPQKGVNIIRYSDGTTKSVYVK